MVRPAPVTRYVLVLTGQQIGALRTIVQALGDRGPWSDGLSADIERAQWALAEPQEVCIVPKPSAPSAAATAPGADATSPDPSEAR
jgi:hypothetical protein